MSATCGHDSSSDHVDTGGLYSRAGRIPTAVFSPLFFLDHDPVHDRVKPFKLEYEPAKGVQRTNCTFSSHDVSIEDAREHMPPFTFEDNGFVLLELRSQLSTEDFYDKQKVESVYYPEVTQLLQKQLNATRVEIVEHLVRRRHVTYPISTGDDYEFNQPTRVVHVDYTEKCATDASITVHNIDPTHYSRMQTVNLWKPLRGPVTDWPLAVCDSKSVNVETDLIALDAVTRTGFIEDYQVYYNDRQDWYFFDRQTENEVVLFRQADTEPGKTGVPHTGFYNARAVAGERPRESIELRAFVYF